MPSDSSSAHMAAAELAVRMKTFRASLSPEARAVFDELLSPAPDQTTGHPQLLVRKAGGTHMEYLKYTMNTVFVT